VCGIVGRFNFHSGEPVEPSVVERMCDFVAHRGPDGWGTHVDGPIGLGHRRLAVIDLSDAGRQPMHRGGLWITYNGEIYNYRELRTELASLGHRFQSQTDTEVILAAYQEWGAGCLSRLHGMFAFGIWDSATRTLFLARDRLGKKPLHYWIDRDGLAFASEPKAFLADPHFEVRPDLGALSSYLSLQYVPAPKSAFAGVEKLPPAHSLTVTARGPSLERYWRLSYGPKRHISEDEAAAELLARLTTATRRRLISDVPLGAFLSGGIDSAAVVAVMAREGGAPVRTFSIGFDEARFNELEYARMVARRYETRHEEFIVRPEALKILPELVWHYNEPFADSSAVPTFYLAELTRRSVTVALNGDAGDENFAGYDRYRASALASRQERWPLSVRRALSGVADRLPGPSSARAVTRMKRFFLAADEPREWRYARWMLHFQDDAKREICTPEFLTKAVDGDGCAWLVSKYADSDASDFLDATLDVDVRTYLPEDLLVKVDIATMAHGLEARSPFLDHELMEFAATLPSSLKLRGRSKKYVLRRAMRGLLPEPILERPKMGFGVPIDVWFRRDLVEYTRDVLLGSPARERGYFRMAVVERLIDEHRQGVREWHHQLWNLVIFELWHQMFVDRRLTPADHWGSRPAAGVASGSA
jgi:asparagine synthase (glutamine-hydrolysing)